MGNPKQTANRIPVFNSIAEEAAFWDAHDSTEFEDEWEPVEVAESLDVRSEFFLEIEFDRETWDQLRELARRRGVRASVLARAWMMEGFARAVAEDLASTAHRPATV